MRLRHFRRPAYAWIAILALLLHAFAPAIAHRVDPLAIAAGGAGLRTAGSRSTVAPAMVDSKAPQRGYAHGNGACPCCLLDGGTPLPPSRRPDFLAVGNLAVVPAAPTIGEWLAAPVRPAAQPRAPPR